MVHAAIDFIDEDSRLVENMKYNTYANYREANRALWRLTLLPLAGKILDVV